MLGAFLLALGALAAIVLEDYRPAKLAPVVMLLSWFPLIGLHEAGHALAAHLLGWSVEEVVVGFGSVVARFGVLGVPCTLKTYPLGGAVRPVPLSLRQVRARSALIYLAGPASEFALVVSLTALVGFDAMTTVSDSVAVIAAQAIALAALIDVFTNLVPTRVETERGEGLTDGLGALTSFVRPRRSFEVQVRAAHEARIVDAELLADAERALRACEHAHREFGDDPHLRAVMIRALEAVNADVTDRALPPRVLERLAQAPRQPVNR